MPIIINVDEITKDSNMDSNKKEEATLIEQEDEVIVDVQANVISIHLKGQVTVQEENRWEM